MLLRNLPIAFPPDGEARFDRVAAMDELEIVRLNVERYRRMLQTESDKTARLAIQKMLEEFETKFALLKQRRIDLNQCQELFE